VTPPPAATRSGTAKMHPQQVHLAHHLMGMESPPGEGSPCHAQGHQSCMAPEPAPGLEVDKFNGLK
jgi:hypothetical protein